MTFDFKYRTHEIDPKYESSYKWEAVASVGTLDFNGQGEDEDEAFCVLHDSILQHLQEIFEAASVQTPDDVDIKISLTKK